MKQDGSSNDNRALDHGVLDPDRHYVDDYMAKACAHFKERGIDRNTVATAMLDELFKMLEGNPFRTGGDEGAVTADIHFLLGMSLRVEPMVKQWTKGWARLQREKRQSFRFNRSVSRPSLPARRPPAPPVDYDPGQHSLDLILLGMRADIAYTEKEVMTRYYRKMKRVKKNPLLANGYDRKKGLDEARNRLLLWIRNAPSEITDQASA